MSINRQQLKNLMLPVAMIGGAVFYKWMGYLSFLSPYLIFTMLFITYCKLNVRDIKPGKEHLMLICVQMALSFTVYFILSPLNHIVGEGVFICIFIPTATAAPVITAMLGGSISFVATYSLLCNALIAVAGPFILAAIGDHPEISFLQSTIIISSKVFPLIIGPLVIALLLRKAFPKLHAKIESHQSLSFYLWAISLFIIVGSCVSFTINTWDNNLIWTVISLVIGALAVCLLQFYIGRKIGKKFGDTVSGGQSLGQKNTVLAVWLAMTYMNPTASIAPAAYIAWQNIVNSWQLVKHSSKVKEE
ncbi:MAG: transporter [Muribaculaceae bacterium]|nr:transporter [Muribaculaceae bacterium]